MAVFGLVSLVTLVVGVYEQQWYGSFGLVMFMTALICNLAAHLGADTATSEKSEAYKILSPEQAKGETFSRPMSNVA